MQDDRELLRCYAEDGSQAAFSELVRRHLNLVYFSALRRARGATHLAQDISQTVFIALARHAGSLRRETVVAGWLYIATRNAAAKAMRTETRRMRREQEAHTMHEEPAAMDAEWERIRLQLDGALDDLEARDRDAVLLRCVQNRPYAEIGDALRISNDAARMRVERALEKLRDSLTRRGITSTTAALTVALEIQAKASAPDGLSAAIGQAVLAHAPQFAAGAMPAGFRQFMNPTTIAVTSGVACLISIGAAFYQAGQAQDASAALAAERKTNAARAQMQTAKLAPKEVTNAPVAASATDSIGSAVADEAPKKRKKSEPPAPAVAFAELMKDPVYAAAWRGLTTREINRKYDAGFRAINLDPRQREQVKELLLEAGAAGRDAFEVAREANLNIEERRKAVAQAAAPWNNQIKLLIGEEAFSRLERMSQIIAFSPTVLAPIVSDLRASEVPLTDAQMTDLTADFSDFLALDWPKGRGWTGTTSAFTEPKNIDPQTGLNAHGQALLSRFAAHLSTAQAQALRQSFVEETRLRMITERP
jgi:RNA polymerase sigma factor (sigma-70 family)